MAGLLQNISCRISLAEYLLQIISADNIITYFPAGPAIRQFGASTLFRAGLFQPGGKFADDRDDEQQQREKQAECHRVYRPDFRSKSMDKSDVRVYRQRKGDGRHSKRQYERTVFFQLKQIRQHRNRDVETESDFKINGNKPNNGDYCLHPLHEGAQTDFFRQGISSLRPDG